MEIKFHPLQITDKALFEQYVSPDSVVSCDRSFAVQYLWKDYYQSEYAIVEDCFFVRGRSEEGIFFFPPFGKGNLSGAIRRLKEEMKSDLLFLKCSEEDLTIFRQSFPNSCSAEEDRDFFEYIYDHEIYFVNKRLQQKVRYFERDHHPEVVVLSGEEWLSHQREIIDFYHRWIGYKTGIQREMAESEAKLVMDHLFRSFDLLQLSALVVRIDGKITGFYIGWNNLKNPMGFALFVKSDITIDYHSDVLFYYGSKYLFPDCRWVNWDRDGGLEGLRFFKERYHPNRLLKSYKIII